MRWKALFDDLEAQAAAADRVELEDEVRDRTRREVGLVRAADRLRACVGEPLAVSVVGAGPAHGTLLDAGPDWLLLEERPGRDALVPLAAVLGVTGVGRRTAAPLDRVGRRLDLRWTLRALVRDRAALQVRLRDGSLLAGTLDRVGADHVDLAEHPQGELRRPAAVLGVRLVPLDALALLRPG
ncbi:MAG TPA: hypothetical protein VFR07_12345 [Mycobacteriales bacterium]|jgi:hypothetical protein|nr:hypothetical protein [Mycobacteriales bacterium]